MIHVFLQPNMEGVFLKAALKTALKTDCWIHRKIRRYSEGLDEISLWLFSMVFLFAYVCLCCPLLWGACCRAAWILIYSIIVCEYTYLSTNLVTIACVLVLPVHEKQQNTTLVLTTVTRLRSAARTSSTAERSVALASCSTRITSQLTGTGLSLLRNGQNSSDPYAWFRINSGTNLWNLFFLVQFFFSIPYIRHVCWFAAGAAAAAASAAAAAMLFSFERRIGGANKQQKPTNSYSTKKRRPKHNKNTKEQQRTTKNHEE